MVYVQLGEYMMGEYWPAQVPYKIHNTVPPDNNNILYSLKQIHSSSDNKKMFNIIKPKNAFPRLPQKILSLWYPFNTFLIM